MIGCGFLLYQYRVHAILSGSMQPYLSPGSVVVSCASTAPHYAVGDVVTFTVPGKGYHITHRITEYLPQEGGAIRTKGDGNPNGDPWLLTPQDIEDKVVAVFPYGWYALHMLLVLLVFLLFWG